MPKIERLQEEGDIEAIIKLLDYKKKAEVRMEAAVALGELKAEEAIDLLLERLDDEDEGVRAAAAVALGSIGDQSVIPALVNQLKDESEVARGGAAEALILFEAHAVDAVIGSLSSPDAVFRDELVHVLTEIGDPAIPSLLDTLSNPGQIVRQGANDALVAMGSSAATFLISHYTEIEKGIQGTIKAILVDMGEEAVDPLITGLGENNQMVVEMASATLVDIGQPGIQPLIIALQDESLVRQAEDVLVGIGDPAVSPLINALSTSDAQTQVGDVLIQMGGTAIDDLITKYESDPDAYQNILRPLVYGLRLADDDLRDQIQTILVGIGEEAVPEILSMAKDSNKVLVGGETFFAHSVQFGSIGTVEGVLMDGGLCEQTVESEGWIVLCQRGENYFIDKVMAVQLGGGVGVIIYNNTEGEFYPTLGEDNDAQIVSVGLTLGNGETLLESMIGEEVVLVNEDTSQVPFTLAEIGTPVIPYLIEALRDETLYTIAEDTLIMIGSSTAPALLEALQNEEASMQVEVLFIMGEINDERFHGPAIEALEHSDPLVREAAAYALARMLPEASIEPLIAKLVDEDEYVVYAVSTLWLKLACRR